MEQQQDELFAMIGQLTYRLQLAQRENERLADENARMREDRMNMINEYNMTFNRCEGLTSENATLRETVARAENIINNNYFTNDQMAGLYGEEPIGGGRPQRQDSVIDHALLITDEQMAGFYGGEESGGCLQCQMSIHAVQMTDDDAMEIDEPMEDCCLQRQASTNSMLMTDEEIAQYYRDGSAETDESVPEWA
jgi:hypothetical protein